MAELVSALSAADIRRSAFLTSVAPMRLLGGFDSFFYEDLAPLEQ